MRSICGQRFVKSGFAVAVLDALFVSHRGPGNKTEHIDHRSFGRRNLVPEDNCEEASNRINTTQKSSQRLGARGLNDGQRAESAMLAPGPVLAPGARGQSLKSRLEITRWTYRRRVAIANIGIESR